MELDFHHPAHGQDLLRIWWIGTGLAASLPFHAAGYHLAESVENVFSCAISSYTPPIKMLQYTRDKVKAKPPKQSVLLVTIPKTPGADDLPGVVEEGQAIQTTICNPHSVRLLAQPNADMVLCGLRNCSIAHFACHGLSDMVDPSNSFLALQGLSESVPEKNSLFRGYLSPTLDRHGLRTFLPAQRQRIGFQNWLTRLSILRAVFSWPDLDTL